MIGITARIKELKMHMKTQQQENANFESQLVAIRKGNSQTVQMGKSCDLLLDALNNSIGSYKK